MKITIDNYEAFLIDYIDGAISTQDLESLKIFLLAHPELDIQLQDLQDMPSLTASTDTAFDYQYLLKEDQGAEFPALDTLMIGHVENVNTHDQEKELKSLLHKHPEKVADLNLYKKTKLPVLYSIFYDNKESLFKEAAVFSMRKILAPLAVAASLLIGVFAIYSYLQEDPAATVAEATQTQITPSIDTIIQDQNKKTTPLENETIAITNDSDLHTTDLESNTHDKPMKQVSTEKNRKAVYKASIYEPEQSAQKIATNTNDTWQKDTTTTHHSSPAIPYTEKPELAQDTRTSISYQYNASNIKSAQETSNKSAYDTKQEKVNTVTKIIAWASNDKVQASATLNEGGKTNYNVHIGNYGVQVSR